MTRKPTAVEVFGTWFDIEYVKEIDGDSELEGCLYKQKRLIMIVENDEWEGSLRHEIMHCFFMITGRNETFTEEIEESLVVMWENGMADLFSVNRHSVRWRFSKKVKG